VKISNIIYFFLRDFWGFHSSETLVFYNITRSHNPEELRQFLPVFFPFFCNDMHAKLSFSFNENLAVWNFKEKRLNRCLRQAVVLLLTVSQSVISSWLQAADWDSWPYFSLRNVCVFSVMGSPLWRVDGSVTRGVTVLCVMSAAWYQPASQPKKQKST